jgi:hypothetical protein
MSRDFDELREERDAEELARLAARLDTSSAPGPRPEFLASLRARMAAEPRRRSWLERLLRGERRMFAWAAPLVAAVVVAALVFTSLLTPPAIAGERVVLLSDQGFVTYDPETLQVKERVYVPAAQPWVILAPDDRTLVFTFGVAAGRRMRICDLEAGCDRTFRDVDRNALREPQQFALSKDGSRAYVRDGDAIRIVDLKSLTVVGAILTPRIPDSPVYLAPDDRRLFQFIPDIGLVSFDVVERREVGRVPLDFREPAEEGLAASVRLVFSPDGSRMYAVGGTGSPTGPVRIRVFDTATLEVLDRTDIDPERTRVLSRHETIIDRVFAFFASLGFVAVGKELGTVAQIALSPDGRRLYAARGAAGPGILVVETATLSAVGLIQSAHDVYGIQLGRDGSSLFALGTPKGTVGEAVLLALNPGTYAVRADVRTGNVAAESAAIVLKPQ